MKHYMSVELLSIFRVSSAPTNPKPPIENFLATVLVLPQNIFVMLNQIIFYCVAVLKRAALQLPCVATTSLN